MTNQENSPMANKPKTPRDYYDLLRIYLEFQDLFKINKTWFQYSTEKGYHLKTTPEELRGKILSRFRISNNASLEILKYFKLLQQPVEAESFKYYHFLSTTKPAGVVINMENLMQYEPNSSLKCFQFADFEFDILNIKIQNTGIEIFKHFLEYICNYNQNVINWVQCWLRIALARKFSYPNWVTEI